MDAKNTVDNIDDIDMELVELNADEVQDADLAWGCLGSFATGGSFACAGSCGSSISTASTLSSAG